MRYNRYVVQSQHDVSQFGDLSYAFKHAELNAPAAVYHGEQVAEIQAGAGGAGLSLHADNRAPIKIFW